jgi:tetratricopeptide (TPR) repeat protein
VAVRERLAADFPAVPEYRQELARGQRELGILLRDVRKRAEAEAVYRQALALQERLVADFPDVPEYRGDLARCRNCLGVVLAEQRRRAEAEAEYRQALALQERLVADFPDVVDHAVGLGGGYCNTGSLVRDGGRPEESLAWYAKAIATLQPVLARQPRLVGARKYLRNSYLSRAEALEQLRRWGEAVADWQQVLTLNDEPKFTRAWQAHLAVAQIRAGEVDKAVAWAEGQAHATQADADALYDCGCIYVQAAAASKDPDAAERHAARAVGLLRDAIAKGYKDAAQMRKDADLDPLRKRGDFQNLLAELEDKK